MPSSDVGAYRVSQEIGWLPFTELVNPATASMYSGFAKIHNDKKQLADKLDLYLVFAYLFVVPAAIGIFILAEPFTRLLLGAQWLDYSNVLGWIALLMLTMPLNTGLQSALISLGKARYLVISDCMMIATIIASFGYLSASIGLQSSTNAMPGLENPLFNEVNLPLLVFTQTRVMLGVLFFLLLLTLYRRLVGRSFIPPLLAITIPLIPSGFMVAVLGALPWQHTESALGLLLSIVAGAGSYAMTLLAVLYIVRKYSPHHSTVLQLIQKVLKRKVAER